MIRTVFATTASAFALAPVGVAVGERWIGRVPVFFARWGFSHAMLAFLGFFTFQWVIGSLFWSEDAGFAELLNINLGWWSWRKNILPQQWSWKG